MSPSLWQLICFDSRLLDSVSWHALCEWMTAEPWSSVPHHFESGIRATSDANGLCRGIPNVIVFQMRGSRAAKRAWVSGRSTSRVLNSTKLNWWTALLAWRRDTNQVNVMLIARYRYIQVWSGLARRPVTEVLTCTGPTGLWDHDDGLLCDVSKPFLTKITWQILYKWSDEVEC